jgi:hypothetical protein
VGFLRRRSNLETELASLHTRRDLLSKQLTTVEGKLDEATARRQVHLLEGDLEVLDGEPVIVERLRDEKAAVTDALTTIDAKIVDAQRRCAEEQDRIKRDAAVKKLNAAAEDLTKLASELSTVSSKIPNVLSAVLELLPVPPVSQPRVSAFVDGVLEALEVAAREARSHVAQITAGVGMVCEPVAQQPVTPPPPEIERAPIFLLGRSRWEENGETITGGPHCTVSPPAPIARAAIEFGHAIAAGSPLAVTLQMRQPPSYANYAPADCLDISQPKPLIKPTGGPTAASLPIHSEFVGKARIGTARVARI